MEAPEGALLDKARESLRNVKDLYFECYLEADFLDLLLGSMPRATSLSLHLNRSFDDINLVPSVLKARQMFTKLELYLDLSDNQVISLIEAYSESLQELKLNCLFLSAATYLAIGTSPANDAR